MKKMFNSSSIFSNDVKRLNGEIFNFTLITLRENLLNVILIKTMIQFKTVLIALVLLLITTSIANATTYYSKANAAWNSNATWSTVGYKSTTNTGTFPKAGDIANIGGGFTVTITANATCATIIIDAGSVLNPGSTRTVSATTSISINGTYTNQSSGAITTPVWICNGTYNHATSSATLPKGTTTSTWSATSNCNITGSYTSATVISNFIGQTFGNFTFNPSSMTNTVCLYGASGEVTIQGNFTITQTGSSTLYLRQYGQQFVGAMNIYGNFNMVAGIFDLHNGGPTPTSSVINLNGNFTLSGTSIFKQTTTQSGSTVKFNFTGTGVQTVSIAPTTAITSQATTSSCAIQFIVTSGATIDMGTSVLKGTNNTSFTLSPGAGIVTANTGGLSTSGATGSIQVSGTRSYSTTANYTYNGTSAQITGNGLTAANNLTISNTNVAGATFSNAINVSGTFAVTTGAHANLGTFISTASSIILGGVTKTAGTSYGGTSSTANVIDSDYFLSNSGLLNADLPAPINLSYNSPFSFRLNTNITQQNPTVTGIVDSYSISPALSAGLNFNTTNGAITGTPSVNLPSTSYTVTASNDAGSTTCQIDISVRNYYYAMASGNWNTGIWAPTSPGTIGGNIPGSGDIVFIGDASISYTVTIPSGYAAACGSLTMGNYSAATVATLTFTDGTSSLNVGNDLIMNRPNATATSAINVNSGTLTVGGTLKLANSDLTPNSSTSLINRVNISTGTVTTKNLFFNGQSAQQSQVVFSNNGILNISGDITFGYILGNLTPSTGTVNFNGTLSQSIPVGVSAVTYNNLTVNNTSNTGAALGSAISSANVTGNLSVGNITTGSTLDNGGYAITLATGKSLNVANGSTLKLSGTSTMATAPGGKTFGPTSTVNYSGSVQTVTPETYGHLTLSGSGTKTMPSSTTTVAGNFIMSGTPSATALAAINTAGNFTLGSGTTFNASTFTHTVGGNWTNSGTFTPATGTIDFNGTGAGNIETSNFNNVTFSGAGTKTATGSLIIGGNINIGNNFSGGVYAHTVAGNWTNSGTFSSGTSSIIFNGTSTQAINNGSSSFFNFTITNTTDICSSTSNGITSTGTFTTNTGSTLNMSTYPLSVATVDHSGTLQTQNTSSIPITSGKTWGGLVNYNGSAAQKAMAGNYNNLTISTTTGGATASGDITVNGELRLDAPNASATVGALEMVTNYTGYPATNSTYLTQTTNPITSYILTMGANATTVGQGDVTGKIYRSSLVANTAYSFGNQYTTYAYTIAPTDVTVTVTIGTAYGQTSVWGDLLSVKRSYEMVPTGGTGGRVAMNLHYLESELNGNTETQLVTGDYDIGPTGAPLGDEHGRSSYDFTNNYIGLSGVPISYFQYDVLTHNWRTVFTMHNYYTTHTVWDGSTSGSWMEDTNWSAGRPGVAMIAVIPDAATTPNDPVLAAGQTIAGLQILSGGILDLNSQTITLAGYNYNGWEDQSGLSNYTGSTVIIKNTEVGGAFITTIPISGVPHFEHLTINSGTNVTSNSNSHLFISGTFTNNGAFDAETLDNTIEYNGSAQTVVSPTNNTYKNLVLSGSAAKTLPATLTVMNNFILNGTASVNGTSLTLKGDSVTNNSTSGSFAGTVYFAGSNQQTIKGTSPVTFNNLTIDNANGLMLNSNVTTNGTLTFTNGKITTEANILTLACAGSISGANTSNYIEGKLAMEYCNELTKDFPIGKGGYYRPMTLTYTASTNSTVNSEVFESASISSTLPIGTTLLSPNRYWTVSESVASGHTFNITLDGTGFNIPGGQVILNDITINPLTSFPASKSVNNYTATNLTAFGNFEIGFTAPTTVTWTGTSNNDWSDASNWDTGYVLTSYNNVVIPSGLTKYPTLTYDANFADLTVEPGGQLTLGLGAKITASTFTLQSDATNGTATFLDNGNGVTAATVEVQQYLTSGRSVGRNWYISSPVSQALSGLLINIPDVQFWNYNEPTNSFGVITALDSLIHVRNGYVAYIPNNTTVNFTGGLLNTGDYTAVLPRTTNVLAKRGFNLVGNPYPSYVNWELATKTNLGSTIWFRTVNNSGTYVFDTYNGGVGTNNNQTAAVTSFIPPMQSVWVMVNAGSASGSVNFTNVTRSHQDIQTNNFRAPAQKNTEQQVLRIQVSNGINSDETILVFHPNAADGYDTYDSPKMTNSNITIPEIFTLIGNEEIVINGMNNGEKYRGIPLGFRTGTANTFVIQANEIRNFNSDVKIILRDNLLNIEQDLGVNPVYSFVSDKITTSDRFSIIFKSANTPNAIQNNNASRDVLIYRNENNKIMVICNGDIDAKSMVSVYNSIGQKLVNKNLNSTVTELQNKFVAGVYIVIVNKGVNSVTNRVVIE